MEMSWSRTSLLGLEELTAEEIKIILELALEFKKNLQNKASFLCPFILFSSSSS